MDTDLVGRHVSWDEYFPGVVCHFSGEVRAVVVDDDGTIALLVEMSDGMGVRKMKIVPADGVKVTVGQGVDDVADRIVEQIGRMGVIVTAEIKSAIVGILEQCGRKRTT